MVSLYVDNNIGMYKVFIHTRDYSSWEVVEMPTLAKTSLDIKPFERKLFANDEFCVDATGAVFIEHSAVRSGSPIPAVLMLEGNKTYGRANSKGKLLYKCVPDDARLPAFLVPYEVKCVGFSKAFANVYVTIQYIAWEDKHPRGKLDCVIGPVDVLSHFYEYQLYCKTLHVSIQKFQKDTQRSLEHNSPEHLIDLIKVTHPSIEDRTGRRILTIDPLNSQDFDDGVGVIDLENGVEQFSIYISNVAVWMDVLRLWTSFSRRISTIYLPDKKRPMLPSVLTDCLCSLQKGVHRVAFVMDLCVQDGLIVSVAFKNAIIAVSHNYVYEDPALLRDSMYQRVLAMTQRLSATYPYLTHVRNSHDLVSYCMILMNSYCADRLIQHKTGIFRSAVMTTECVVPSSLPEDVARFVRIWTSTSGQYIAGEVIEDTRHVLLNVDAYLHITSPIRRLVDLLNMVRIQHVFQLLTLSADSTAFYDQWIQELDYINQTTRSIRKVQCDCSLLDVCYNVPETLEKVYVGYVFDKLTRNDGTYKYTVFLPELKMSSRIVVRENVDNFTSKSFRLFLFKDEEHFKHKIRLQLA